MAISAKEVKDMIVHCYYRVALPPKKLHQT